MVLRERLNEWGISVAEFDFDDTLIKTEVLFTTQMRSFVAQTVGKLGGPDVDEVWRRLEEVNNQAFRELAVNPKRWETVVQRMEEAFPEGRGVFVEALPTLMRIYKIIPELHDRAVETVGAFREAGVGIGMVTHANREWTDFKLDGLDLRNYFDRIHVVDENKHKGPEDWAEAIAEFGVSPEQAIVVGDSLPGDIRASAAIGVKHRVWVPSKWVMYNSGEVPEGTIKVEGIGKVPAVLENL